MALPRFVLPVALLALAAGGAYYYYQKRAAAQTGVPEYTTTTVSKGEVTQAVTATGSLDAVRSIDVGSQISGQIVKLYADFNTVVKEGQKLVEIDPASYQQKLRQAEANLASAQASFRITELNATRTKDLFEKSLVTQQDNDQAQATLEQARAQLKINQASVDNAKVDLSRCTIFSPIDGVVISKLTEEGKTVAASMNVPVLFTIANDLAKMQITAAVAEADIGAVAETQAVNFTVDAFPNRTFRGTVTQVRNAPKNTSNVITYDTIISVDNRDLKLRPGMTANVSIVVARREGVLRTPNAALRVRMPEGLATNSTPAATKPADGPKPAAGADATVASAPAAGGASAGPGGGNPNSMRRLMGPDAPPEAREKMRAIMAEVGVDFRQGPPTPEQRDQIRKLMVERGLITAEQAAESDPRRSAAGNEPVYTRRTVYRLPGGNKLASPEAVHVSVGITDGLVSEIAPGSGLNEGDVILTSVTVPGAKGATPTTNPFGGQRRF